MMRIRQRRSKLNWKTINQYFQSIGWKENLRNRMRLIYFSILMCLILGGTYLLTHQILGQNRDYDNPLTNQPTASQQHQDKIPTITSNFNSSPPKLYPNVKWKAPTRQETTVIKDIGEYIDVNIYNWVSEPVTEYHDFIEYYTKELIAHGWTQTGHAEGKNLHSFWMRNNRYFVFGYEWDVKLDKYFLFVQHE